MENNISPAMPTRWALGIEYDGQYFSGWQQQPDRKTIQSHLEDALAQVACEPISVVGAGRTDTGVHALYQILHFDTHATRLPTAWIRGANHHLPYAIRILWAQTVSHDFHARFSACKRSYRYALYSASIRPAIFHKKVGWTHYALNENSLVEALSFLIGEHDFSAFRSSACQSKNPVKTMYQASITRRGDFWLFDFAASGFLHHMIRNIMGALVMIGAGKKPPVWISELLHQKIRSPVVPTFSPDGLYLTSVEYPEPWQFPEPAYLVFD